MTDIVDKLHTLYGMHIVCVDESHEYAPEPGECNIKGRYIYVLESEWDILREELLKKMSAVH